MESLHLRVMHEYDLIRIYRDISRRYTEKDEEEHRMIFDVLTDCLTHRGFTKEEDSIIKKNYDSLSKHHRYCFNEKKQLIILFEYYRTGVNIKFGYQKNYPLGKNSSGFVPKYHYDRYKKHSYVEKKWIELEMKKMVNFLVEQFSAAYEDVYAFEDTDPVEYILKKEAINKHIHGGAKSLEDIAKGMSKHDLSQNNKDANHKVIECGEEKYFYDEYNRYLMKGIVYHNINNMWWVITGNGLTNIASFRLFDYTPGLPRRKPIPKEYQLKKINELMKKEIEMQNFERCIDLRYVIGKLN